MPISALVSADSYQGAWKELEEHERALSAERRRLQDRIDFVRATGATQSLAESDQLRHLEERERELSARRRSLHRQIDALHGRKP
jgi:predicted  nucleic acid-binding Zn-ribbon protein